MSGESTPNDAMNTSASNINLCSDSTMLKLAESMNQHTASALTSIQVPEFKGLPYEDVHDFLKKFKVATLILNDEMKCLALQKALIGAAHNWSKNTIKGLLASGNWRAVKRALVERFEEPDRHSRYHERLEKLKFSPGDETLISFVEKFADCYRRAFKDPDDEAIITGLKLKLPGRVLRALNILNDDWTSLKSIDEVYKLVRRAEAKILPFEGAQEEEDKLTASTMAKLLADFKKSLTEQNNPEKPKPVADENALAAIRYDNNFRKPSNNLTTDQSQQVNGQLPNYQPRPRNYGRREPPVGQYKYNRERRQAGYPYPSRGPNEAQGFSSNDTPRSKELREAYYQRYGHPPGPCQLCSGEHYNRHCPLVNLN